MTGRVSFIHPRQDCIATCLWWILAAVAAEPMTTKGIVALPYNPEAAWWPLVSKLRVLITLPVGTSPVLESWSRYGWHARSCKHPVMLCAFPVVPRAVMRTLPSALSPM